MSQKISLLTLSLAAAGAIQADRFVTLAGTVAAAGVAADGVACTDANTGEYFPYDVLGTSTVVAEAVITKGQRLQVGATGGAVPRTTGVLVGIALQAGAVGERIEVLLIQGADAA
ncbi:capsid cement protein [Achromobacter xylosoxidans]|uniref:capsid cement protein n=1 Tax=Alcaligenes xylosoxydans xylosoxydans TaxID=85698 RepID=UPI000B494256|nr:capsid cement protein [Achromobacter xylosoxidans]